MADKLIDKYLPKSPFDENGLKIEEFSSSQQIEDFMDITFEAQSKIYTK